MWLDEESQQRDGYGATPSWDDDGYDGGFDDGHAYSDVEEPSGLVSQPRQVNRFINMAHFFTRLNLYI